MIEETGDLAACHALRRAVFVDEQGVPPDEEWDDLDAGAVHLLVRGAQGEALGTARLRLEGRVGHIGRVCVLREARGTGLGAAMMRAALAALRTRGASRAELGAQRHALGFYEKLGFVAEGPVYDDAGIAHRHMICML